MWIPLAVMCCWTFVLALTLLSLYLETLVANF